MDLPRWLDVDLTQEESVAVRPWVAPLPQWAAVGEWGGVAAALARSAQGQGGLQVAVGPAVVAGLPTAARATVLGRSPLTGGPAEGQVGSDFARRLARVADLVTLRGRTNLPGAVLLIGEGGARLESLPRLGGATPLATHRMLVETFGPLASLRVGPAAEAGVAWANLAAGSAPQSFVGRGGLGALLAAHGLKAIAVVTEPVGGRYDPDLEAALARSPRLIARARKGTFELAEVRAAAGELSQDAAQELGRCIEARRSGRHGCMGCPTPCGLSFEREGGPPEGARFSAVDALGSRLGLGPDEALELLARCNALGLDAKQAGVVLAALRREGGLGGTLAAYDRALQRIAQGELEGRAGEEGRGEPGGTRDPARLLAQRCAVRGGEPMRTSAGLLVGTGEAEAGERVHWHENLAAALDASGFCAFAAAGLIGDGGLSLDALARILAGVDGETFLWRGAVLVALVAEAAEAFGTLAAPPREEPFTREGMWPTYRRLRGLTAEGRLAEAGRAAALLTRRRPPLPRRAAEEPIRRDSPPWGAEVRPGRLQLLGCGGLAGLSGELELPLPTRLIEALGRAEGTLVGARGKLLSGGRLLPTVYREGRVLAAEELVHAGDRLELVLAVAGG